MKTRHHRDYGHGLAPGTDYDINCLHCRRDRVAVREVLTRKYGDMVTPEMITAVIEEQEKENGYGYE